MKALPLVAAAALVLAAAPATAADPWSKLRRPLHIPQIESGAPCPTAVRTGDLAVFGLAPFSAWGAGPAYPAIDPRRAERPTVRFEPVAGSDIGGAKVMWAVERRYRGPVLVRGRQLDGPNIVRFENGRPGFTLAQRLHPKAELRIWGGGSVWPAVTRVPGAGCYAWQVDGTSFSRVIVFTAQPL